MHGQNRLKLQYGVCLKWKVAPEQLAFVFRIVERNGLGDCQQNICNTMIRSNFLGSVDIYVTAAQRNKW